MFESFYSSKYVQSLIYNTEFKHINLYWFANHPLIHPTVVGRSFALSKTTSTFTQGHFNVVDNTRIEIHAQLSRKVLDPFKINWDLTANTIKNNANNQYKSF